MAPACADASPATDEEGPAEQVRPDLEAVVAMLIVLRQDADEGCGFREERELNRSGSDEDGCATFGHGVALSVTQVSGKY